MSPYAKYKSNIISTASKEQKMLMIFNEAIKMLNKAIICIETNDFAGKSANLHNVANIFINLSGAFDPEKGGKLAETCNEFCARVANRIDFINMGKSSAEDIEKINDIVKGIIQIKELFEEESSSANST